MSDWIELTGNTDIGDLPDHLMTDLGLLRSRFVATAWPANPVPGQPCVRSDRGYRAYTYTNDPLLGESGWVEDALLSATVLALKAELEASRGTAANLGARLSVAMNPDGSLKDPAPAGSWWATEADDVAYASATTFTVEGDKTGVYTTGRALHLAQTASGYGYVVSSTYASGIGLTTVTVRGVAVDSGLDQIEYSSQVEAMPYGVATSSNKGVVQLGTDVPRFITSNTSFYISPSGSDSTGDGSSGSPWKTLSKAFTYLGAFRIKPGYTVTITLMDGVNDFGGNQIMNHVDGRQINIYGHHYYQISLTSIQSSSGSAGNFSIVLNVSDVSNVVVGDFIASYAPSGGTNPKHMSGLFEVSAVDAVNTRITVTSPNYVGVPSGAVTGTLNVIKAVAVFGGTAHGIDMSKGQIIGSMGDLVIKGPGTSYYGLYLGHTAGGDGCCLLRADRNVGVWGWGSGVIVSGNSVLFGRGLAVGHCVEGVKAMLGGVIDGYGMAVNGCSTRNVGAMYSASIYAPAADIVGGATGVYAAYGSHIQVSDGQVAGLNTVDYSPAKNTNGNSDAYITA